MKETIEEFLERFYLNEGKTIGEDDRSYCNSYVQMAVIMKNTPENIQKMEDILYKEDNSSNYRAIKSFYGYIEEEKDGYCTFNFSSHKGFIMQALRLSEMMPDSIVFVSDDWNEHYFYVAQNGVPYTNYTVSINTRGPYEESDTIYYDIDADVVIDINGTSILERCGGGMCTESEYQWFCKEVSKHTPTKEDIELE